MYEAHRQIELPLTLMKIDHDKNMQELMPTCRVEEIGGYAFLREAQINGDNQPP